MIVGAPKLERVCAFEAERDPILIIHANGVQPSQVTDERVQPVAGRHFEILEPRHGVDLIEFETHAWPELARNPPSRLTVDAVPDVPGRFIGKRPDHRIAL